MDEKLTRNIKNSHQSDSLKERHSPIDLSSTQVHVSSKESKSIAYLNNEKKLNPEFIRRIEFAEFTYYPADNTLFYRETLCEFDEKVMLLLRMLIEARPNLVTKSQLMEKIWPDIHVSDWSLARLVSDTRKLLEDDGKSQNIIKTVRGKGFSFVAKADEIIDTCRQHETSINSESSRSAISSNQSQRKSKLAEHYILIALSMMVLLVLIGWLVKSNQHDDQSLSITPNTEHSQSTDAPLSHSDLSNAHRFQIMREIQKQLNITKTAFLAQVRRRDEFGELVLARFPELEEKSWEQRFRLSFNDLNDNERFLFTQIRSLTQGVLFEGNQALLQLLEQHPEIYDTTESLGPLHAHLRIWISKYHNVFLMREDMAVLYVGVEDGVPFPTQVDQEVSNWLIQNRVCDNPQANPEGSSETDPDAQCITAPSSDVNSDNNSGKD